jgi:hypothetical protein
MPKITMARRLRTQITERLTTLADLAAITHSPAHVAGIILAKKAVVALLDDRETKPKAPKPSGHRFYKTPEALEQAQQRGRRLAIRAAEARARKTEAALAASRKTWLGT